MNPLWLTFGLLAGYLLLMWSHPVRASVRDGGRMLRRYPALWLILSAFGLGYALYGLAMRLVVSQYIQDDPRWSLSLQWPQDWWLLDRAQLRLAAADALLPALDSVAGLFSNLVSTFPLAAIAALLLIVNWRGHQLVLVRALQKRFGGSGWAIHGFIVLCALAAILKPLLTCLAFWTQQEFWLQWSAVIAWLAFLFEYSFGFCIQLYLILLAFCWVRGLAFNRQKLLDFAIRRFSILFRFAALVMLISSILIDLPLILGSLGLLPRWPALMDEDPSLIIEQWTLRARAVLSVMLILAATVQITLTFHSESLRRALRDHFTFLRQHAWPFFWFLVIAAVHLYGVHLLDAIAGYGLGEGSLPWACWRLLFAILHGTVGAWLLASWVSLYKRCGSGRVHSENWIQF